MRRSLLFSALVLLSGIVIADSQIFVKEQQENLRDSPNGKQVGTLVQGAKLDVIETSGEWVKVSVEGWIWKASTSKEAAALSDKQPKPQSKGMLTPIVSGKRYDNSDIQDYIWFDVKWNTANLPKPTRAVKGTLVFADLFDDPKFMIGWTINDPMTPGGSVNEKGVGFEYNQFIDSHMWMRTTDLKDMTVSFEIKNIIYQDGTKFTK